MKNICKALMGVVLMASALAGCNAAPSEPEYGGLSMEAFNYTPYNLDRFVIKDKYGNQATGGGDLPPGSGEGSLTCCYKLKGTEFQVNWESYDIDAAPGNPSAPINYIHSSATIHIPPTEVKGGSGTRILGLHFYPDGHIEPEFRTDLGGSRFNYGAINHRLVTKYEKQLNPGGELNFFQVFRRNARTAAQGWIKYRLIDDDDLEQYVYFTLLVNRNFDQHPQVKKILDETREKRGAFAAAMSKLPASVISEMRKMPSGEKKER